MVNRFDRNSIRIKPHDFLEAFRDRFLKILLRKLHNVPRWMKRVCPKMITGFFDHSSRFVRTYISK